MTQKKIKVIIAFAIISTLFILSTNAQSKDKNRKEPPTVDEIFKELDKNEDGKLSLKEIKGPLKRDFAKIDTDEDGFITKKELEKAPKPKRRERQ
jgi:Ca2+-binding EF-hand superfamily protein